MLHRSARQSFTAAAVLPAIACSSSCGAAGLIPIPIIRSPSWATGLLPITIIRSPSWVPRLFRIGRPSSWITIIIISRGWHSESQNNQKVRGVHLTRSYRQEKTQLQTGSAGSSNVLVFPRRIYLYRPVDALKFNFLYQPLFAQEVVCTKLNRCWVKANKSIGLWVFSAWLSRVWVD